MGAKVHVLAKNGTFLFRFNDSEFGSKWCGIWKKETKFFDYFAFEVNGVFLSHENISKFEFYNSQFCRFIFQTKEGPIIEELTCLDDAVAINLKPSFVAAVSMEVGVNIRDRSENYVKEKRYHVSRSPKKIKTSFNDKSSYILFDKGTFSDEEYYGIHVPGRYSKEQGFSGYFDDCSTQNKYVPGLLKLNLNGNEELNVILSAKDMDNETAFKTIKNRTNSAKEYSEIVSRNASNFTIKDIIDNELLKDSIDAIYSFSNFNDNEMYAGYPYFNQFWLRDALFVLPSFLSLNNAGFVRETLKKIARHSANSGLPNIYGGSLFPADVPALFIICTHEYFAWTGDIETLEYLRAALQTALNIGRGLFERGTIHDKGNDSWMDSLDREYSIEVQALWIKAFEYGVELNVALTEETSDLTNMALQLRSNIPNFKRNGYFSDQLHKDINSANQLFLVFYDILEQREKNMILENLEKNAFGTYGVYSVSANDKAYNPKSYQNGSIWPFLTNILAASAVKNGKTKLAKQCLGVLRNNLDLQCSSRINEILQPDGVPRGSPSQALSMGMLPYLLDKFFLGIEVNAPKNEIKILKSDYNPTAKRSFIFKMKEIRLEFLNGNVMSNKEVSDEGDYFRIKL